MKRALLLMFLVCVIGFAHGQNWLKNQSKLYYVTEAGRVYIEPDFSSYAVYFKNSPDSDVKRSFATISEEKDINVMSSKQMLIMKQLKTKNAFATQQDKQSFFRAANIDDAYDIVPSFRVNGEQVWLSKRVTLELKDGVSLADISDVLDEHQAIFLRNTLNDQSLLLEIGKIENQLPLIQKLEEMGVLEWGHPDFRIEIDRFNDPFYPEQFQMNNTGGSLDGQPLLADIDIDAAEAWGVSTGSSSITVAIIDDGVESHPDLPAISAGFTPATGGNGTPLSGGAHGESCAGIIAAQHNNSIGVRGVAPGVNLIAVNIFQGSETVQDLADAFTWSVNQGADVISNSWGFSGNCSSNLYQTLTTAINNAASNGRGGLGSVIVFASGNDFNSCVSYPGNLASVIAVGAVRPDGAISSYSNQGSALDVVAPSNDYNSTQTGFIYGVRTIDRTGSNGYETGDYNPDFGGTSAACPAVAGTAALILSVNSSLSSTDVYNILTSTADDMGSSGFDNTFGYGRVNAHSAVLAAGGSSDTEAPTIPTGLSASNIGSSSFDLSWNASTDNTAVTGYTVYLNGSSIGSVSGTTASVTGLSPSTTYSVTVSAFDAAANESSQSSAINVTTTVATISCSATVSSFPYAEGFEVNDGWNQLSGDDGDWVRDANGTPSSGTGPSSAIEGSYYMFLEASTNGSTGQIGSNATAILESDCFDLSSATSAEFTFQNHMYGSNVGSLELLVTNDGSNWTSLWSLSGNQGNQWNQEVISLTGYAGSTIKLRIVGTTGNGWSSDIAIDDLNLTTNGAGGDTQAPSTPAGLSSSAVTSSSFDVSWTASTDNVGVTGYNVYLNGSLDGTTTATSYSFSGLAASTTYTVSVEAFDAASNVSGQASTNVTTSAATVTYCSSSGNNVNYEWIDLVQLGSINNATGANGGYGDFTAQSTDLALNSSNTVSFSAGFSGTTYSENWAVYIDYNHNGDFTDSGEQVITGSTSNGNTYSSSFTVPSSATLGSTRMRVVMRWNTAVASCGTFSYGEVEDYTVNITSTSSLSTTNNSLVGEVPGEIVIDDALSVYPNPAASKLYIDKGVFKEVTGARIYTIGGQLVKSIDKIERDELDVSALKGGLYIIELNTERGKYESKFVKE